MGDIADMMLDGTLCSQCGEFIDKEDYGSPQRCASCAREERKPKPAKGKPSKKKKTVVIPFDGFDTEFEVEPIPEKNRVRVALKSIPGLPQGPLKVTAEISIEDARRFGSALQSAAARAAEPAKRSQT